jgi:hypothetical protein
VIPGTQYQFLKTCASLGAPIFVALDHLQLQCLGDEIEIGNSLTIIIENRNRLYATLRDVKGIP